MQETRENSENLRGICSKHFQSSFMRISFCKPSMQTLLEIVVECITNFQSSFMRISFCKCASSIRFVKITKKENHLSILFYEDFFLQVLRVLLTFTVFVAQPTYAFQSSFMRISFCKWFNNKLCKG